MAGSPKPIQPADFKATTVPGLLWERADRTPDQVAFRAKRRGVYQERTWDELRRQAAGCALALGEMGLTRGARLAFMGDACQEYAICELAAQALGGLTLGIYPSTCPRDLAHILDSAQPAVLALSGQAELERIRPLLAESGRSPAIIMLGGQAGEGARSFRQLLGRGRELLAAHPESMDRQVARLRGGDGLFIAYTAGAGGPPKGVLVSNEEHLTATASLLDRYPLLAAKPHRTVAFLPQGTILGRQTALTLPLLTRMVPHYGEGMEGLATTLFETAPSVLILVPPYLRKMASSLGVALAESSPLKRGAYGLARRLAGRRPGGLGGFLSRRLALGPILNKLGFNQLELVLCTGGALAPSLQAFWQALGLNLCQYHSQAETCGAAVMAQADDFPDPGQGGQAPHGWELRLGQGRELLVRGPAVGSSYSGGHDSPGKIVDARGWLHTGDQGEMDGQGRFRIAGPATRAEEALAASPYVSQAAVMERQGARPAVLIELDLDAVSSWARGRGLAYTGTADLMTHSGVRELIQGEITTAGAALPAGERPAGFAIIPDVLDPARDEDPLTPTRVIKREAAMERFRGLLEAV